MLRRETTVHPLGTAQIILRTKRQFHRAPLSHTPSSHSPREACLWRSHLFFENIKVLSTSWPYYATPRVCKICNASWLVLVFHLPPPCVWMHMHTRVCIHTCSCECCQACTTGHTWQSEDSPSACSHLSPCWRLCLIVGAAFAGLSDPWLPQILLLHLPPSCRHAGLTGMSYRAWLYVDSGETCSGFHAYAANTLPTELLPQPQLIFSYQEWLRSLYRAVTEADSLERRETSNPCYEPSAEDVWLPMGSPVSNRVGKADCTSHQAPGSSGAHSMPRATLAQHWMKMKTSDLFLNTITVDGEEWALLT